MIDISTLKRFPDVSVIVTAHREGRLAHRSMRSLERSISHARKSGLLVETIIVLDRPDQITTEYFCRYTADDIQVTKVDFGDLGLARNHGVELSMGRNIAILDADDLFCLNWLISACRYLDKYPGQVIVHPEYHLVFESELMLWQLIPSDASDFSFLGLLEYNFWSSVCMARREVFFQFPYTPTTVSDGFGFEDWHFNCETLAAGIGHHIVRETVHFLRRKRTGSLTVESNNANRVVRPSKLFESKHLADQALIRDVQGKLHYTINPIPLSAKLFCRIRSLARNGKRWLVARYPSAGELLKALKGILKSAMSTGQPAPEWLVSEWRAISEIEPPLFPSRALIKCMPTYRIRPSVLGRHYCELREQCGENLSHVFLVPWLERGGAEKVALNYLHALCREGYAGKVAVIADTASFSPWEKLLPEGVRYIRFGEVCQGLATEEQERLLCRLLLQLRPSVIHTINSKLGYEVLVKFGAALRQESQLFVSSFCENWTREGQIIGYPSRYLISCFDRLAGVFCDSEFFTNQLLSRYGLEPSRLYVHYQPLEADRRRASTANSGNFEIFWAGRLDRQKRPDILAAIAEACIGLPCRFHVYGTPLLDKDTISKRLSTLPNVELYGAYEGFSSLPIESCQLFLYTSEIDGLPNVLLEAAAAGLPLLAPAVGGISELVIANQTGFLVEHFDDVESYVKLIETAIKSPDMCSRFANEAYRLLSERHSWAGFMECLRKVPGYLTMSQEQCCDGKKMGNECSFPLYKWRGL